MSTKSRNLTAEDKNTILDCVLRTMYKKLFNEPTFNVYQWKLVQASKLGDEVYRSFVPKELERKLNALPDGVVPVSTKLTCVREAVASDESYEGRSYFEFTLSEQRRIPYSLYSERAAVDEKSPVFAKLRAIDKQARQHETTVRKVEAETRQVLAGIRTVRTLLERWPEVSKIEGIPPEILDETPRTALIVMPTTVNTMLGIG